MTNSWKGDQELSRREFTVEGLMTLFAGVVITVTACGGDDGGPANVGPGGANNEVGIVSDNHAHSATVLSADLTAGNAVTLDIRGGADHPHTVVLSATEVVQIRDGQRVAKASSTDPSAAFGVHQHTVTFN
jgi:hypothetical protein